jgi:uncharacterized protein (TIGR02145 family)
LCGIAKVTVTTSTENGMSMPNVKGVRLIANEYVSGEATVTITSSGSSIAVGNTSSSKKYVDVKYTGTAQDATGGLTFYIVVPPNDYTAGLRIQLLNESGGVFHERYANSTVSIVASHITDLGNIPYPYVTTPAAHTGWAGSNIYWDDSDPLNPHPTFDDVGDDTNEYYQGIFFPWGMLIGYAPYMEDTSTSTFSEDLSPAYTNLYVPGGTLAAPNGSTWNIAHADPSTYNTWNTTISGFSAWAELPDNDETFSSVLYDYYHHFLYPSHGNYKGDICKFLAANGWAPASAKGWRMPTADEWDAMSGTFGAMINGSFTGTDTEKIAGRGCFSPNGSYDPDFPLSGYISPMVYTSVTQVGERGNYWTATLVDYTQYGAYNFSVMVSTMQTRDCGDRTQPYLVMFPVRCVRN